MIFKSEISLEILVSKYPGTNVDDMIEVVDRDLNFSLIV